jgi:two-component system chemotaxis response regulator CheB
MTDWLSGSIALPVHIAVHGDPLQPGHVYFAPDDHHMGVTTGGTIHLDTAEPIRNLRPAITWLFESVADSFGPKAAGILLSGMGSDGSLALKELKQRGAITMVQSEQSSVVYGMPRKAIELDDTHLVLTPVEMADLLRDLGKTVTTNGIEEHTRQAGGQ